MLRSVRLCEHCWKRKGVGVETDDGWVEGAGEKEAGESEARQETVDRNADRTHEIGMNNNSIGQERTGQDRQDKTECVDMSKERLILTVRARTHTRRSSPCTNKMAPSPESSLYKAVP